MFLEKYDMKGYYIKFDHHHIYNIIWYDSFIIFIIHCFFYQQAYHPQAMHNSDLLLSPTPESREARWLSPELNQPLGGFQLKIVCETDILGFENQ